MTTLTDEQMTAMKLFHSPRPSRATFVVSGGPGTGKTTLLKHMRSPFSDVKHLIVAPTGCAVERVKQATGFDSYVISKLEFTQLLIDEYKGCILFVDEASMASVHAVAMLMHILEPIKLVILGDEHQLPCIGEHSLLDTMLSSGSFHVVRLTRNLRQLGDGGRANALVKAIAGIGRPGWVIEQDESFRIFTFATIDQAIAAAAKDYKEREAVAQMIGYTNVVVDKLNAMTDDVGQRKKVVCTENCYRGNEMLAATGSRGRINANGVVEYDNGFVDTRRVTQYVAAQCLTVDKAQGSEFEEHGIIVPSWRKGGIRADLTYTAISRFRHSVAIYGSKAEVDAALSAQFVVRPGDPEVVALLRDMAGPELSATECE